MTDKKSGQNFLRSIFNPAHHFCRLCLDLLAVRMAFVRKCCGGKFGWSVLVNSSHASLIRRFCKNNKHGYNYIKFFEIKETKSLNGSLKIILKSKNTSGIVLHMLGIFDTIKEAHCQQGQLQIDKTLAACKPMFYSPTYELCTIYCEDCYICHEKTAAIEPKKGGGNPSFHLSSAIIFRSISLI